MASLNLVFDNQKMFCLNIRNEGRLCLEVFTLMHRKLLSAVVGGERVSAKAVPGNSQQTYTAKFSAVFPATRTIGEGYARAHVQIYPCHNIRKAHR